MLELLAPAGGHKAFTAAVSAGANAIYLGVKKFSARGAAENFDFDSLENCVKYARLFGVKIYVALNTLVKNRELDEFFHTVGEVVNCGADAIIVQDMLLGKILANTFPDIDLHLSTQAGVCNEYGAELAKEFGFSRVICARETSLADISKISKIIETEVFVQGAICSSVSGQCYMSALAGGNSGNRGQCKQPCRKKYVYDCNGKTLADGYALSISDLSVGARIKELIDAGVSSFKIEGRMRRPEYVAAATDYYRALLDDYIHSCKSECENDNLNQNLSYDRSADLTKSIDGNIVNEKNHSAAEGCKYFHGAEFSQCINKSYINNSEADISDCFTATELNPNINNKYINDSESSRLSALKRTFNRNDYTKGLAFGQRADFISSVVQGHKGEYIGKVVSITNGKAVIKDNKNIIKGNIGDSYKIFRKGQEVGSAVFLENSGEGLTVKSNSNLKLEDEVNITTDAALNQKLITFEKKLPVKICATLRENALPQFFVSSRLGEFVYYGKDKLQRAITQSITAKEVEACFLKTDDYPFVPVIECEIGNTFVPKSMLNSMRREIYQKIFDNNFVKRTFEMPELYKNNAIMSDIIKSKNIFILQSNFDFKPKNCDKIVLSPLDYNDNKIFDDFFSKVGSCETYLYAPAFANGTDVEIIKKRSHSFDGIYAEGYYAVALAKKLDKKCIVGTGLNIFNNIDIDVLSNLGIGYENIVLSKELSASELKDFSPALPSLCLGSESVMEFVYCPFGKKCNECNLKQDSEICLTDENNRRFKVLRYRVSECRFTLLNAYDLVPQNLPANRLVDLRGYSKNQIKAIMSNINDTKILRELLYNYTNGVLNRGVL